MRQKVMQYENINRNTLFRRLFVLFGAGGCLFIAGYVAFAPPAQGYENLFLLPLTYAFLLVVFRRVFYNQIYRIGVAVLNAITFLRFVVVPFIMSFTGYINSEGIFDGTILARQQAVWLMIYEILIVYLILYIATRKFRFDQIRPTDPAPELILKHGSDNLLIFAVLIILAALIVVLPQSFTFITFFSQSRQIAQTVSMGGAILAMSLKAVLTMAILHNLYRGYLQSGKKIYIYLSFLASLISIGIVTTDARNYVMMFLVTCVFVLFIFYRKQINLAMYIVGGIVLLITVYTTLFGMTVQSRGYERAVQTGVFMGEDFEDTAGSLQAYFSGVTNIAISIDMNENFMYYDRENTARLELHRSVFPLNVMDKGNIESITLYSITDLYNYQAKGTFNSSTSICPMLGQGLFFFGKALSPIFSVFFTLVLVLFERLRFHEKFNRYYFMLTLSSVAMGMMHLYSASINLRNLTNLVLPAWFIILVVRLFEKLWRGKADYSEALENQYREEFYRRQGGRSHARSYR